MRPTQQDEGIDQEQVMENCEYDPSDSVVEDGPRIDNTQFTVPVMNEQLTESPVKLFLNDIHTQQSAILLVRS
jgi:hypothetical protein